MIKMLHLKIPKSAQQHSHILQPRILTCAILCFMEHADMYMRRMLLGLMASWRELCVNRRATRAVSDVSAPNRQHTDHVSATETRHSCLLTLDRQMACRARRSSR